jgi:hypothetical protein
MNKRRVLFSTGLKWSGQRGKKKIVCQNSQAKRGKKRKKKKKGVIDTKSSSVSSLILPTSS